MFYNFRTCYSTVSNIRWYEHKCHFRKIVFYSTFSLSSQYLIQCFLSLLTVFTLSDPCSLPLSFSDHLPHPQNNGMATSPIKPPITNHPPSPSHRSMYAIVEWYDGLTDQRYAIVLRLCIAFSSPISSLWVCVGGCGFVPVVDVGLCRWWVWDVGLFGLVNVGLCRSLWLCFVLVFFFFF